MINKNYKIGVIMKTLGILLLIITSAAYAQFETVVFSKAMRLNFASKNIYPLGDQNKDGYDDIMLYDCNEKTGYIYFGGNPMDTIPKFTIHFFDSVYVSGNFAILDINDDGINEIIVTTVLLSDSGYYHLGPIRVYYGGNKINVSPDLAFNPPKGATGAVPEVLKDFNGDGRKELVIRDANLPHSSKQYGTFYFYNTEPKFDTIPHFIMQGDSVKKISIGSMDAGDINGDGKTDFTIYGTVGDRAAPDRFFRSFYLGNANFDLTPVVTYYQDEHKFDLSQIKIVNDMNGDGKDDILISDYGYYKYYYVNAILHGSFPIDTIPAAGLNTQNEGLNLGQTYSLGDVNGDGYKDFISSTHIFGYQNVKLWLGGKWFPWNLDDAANRTWYGTSTGFGRILSDVGDVDGDGVNDIAIGQMLYTDDNPPQGACTRGRIYIIKGDTSVVTSVKESSSIIPTEYKLEEPHPNPFNPATTISYKLQAASKVSLKVYDVLGREAVTLVNEEKQAGKYNVELDAGKHKLSSGVYFVKMEVFGNNSIIYSSTKKLMLLK